MKENTKNKRIKFERCSHYKIQNDDEVKITEFTGGRTQITQSLRKACNLSGYTRSRDNTYWDPESRTYKIYSVEPIKSRANLIKSLKNTVEPLLVNNFFGANNEVFITLTFDEPMKDFYRITDYYDRFWRKLCGKYSNLELACVYVKEMQYDRTSWHIHSLIKEIHNKKLYIPWDILYNLWEQGNVWINRIIPEIQYNSSKEINIEQEMNELAYSLAPNLGIASVISYMCKLKSKLNVFPNGSQIHGRKGKIIKPKVSKISFDKARATILDNSHRVSQKTFLVKDIDDNVINRVHKEFWVMNEENTDDE